MSRTCASLTPNSSMTARRDWDKFSPRSWARTRLRKIAIRLRSESAVTGVDFVIVSPFDFEHAQHTSLARVGPYRGRGVRTKSAHARNGEFGGKRNQGGSH